MVLLFFFVTYSTCLSLVTRGRRDVVYLVFVLILCFVRVSEFYGFCN